MSAEDSDYLKRLNATFEQCKAAANDSQHHALLAHMWEIRISGDNPVADTCERRSREMGQVLNVMAGDSNSVYCDKGFLKETRSEHRENDFHFRWQKGSQHGMVGLACCPLNTDIHSPMFDQASYTGLLLRDPEICYVTPFDNWSVYYQHAEGLPKDIGWKEMAEVRPQFAGFQYFADHPEQRQELVGKFGLMNLKGGTDDIHPYVRAQLPEGTDTSKGFALLDPTAPETLQRARRAFHQLADEVKSGKRTIKSYAEVDVNAQLQNAVGIVVDWEGGNITGDRPWSEELQGQSYLQKRLYYALEQRDQLAKTLREHGIDHEPTIVIYQHTSKEHRMVHFPATQQTRAIVEGLLKERGVELPVRSQGLE